jgi:hypothetical protein
MTTNGESDTVPPWVLNPESEWITPGEFAKRWRMHRHTILNWCRSGHLLERGYSTYCDEKKHWYIRIDR